MKVKEIMTREVKSLSGDETVEEALSLIYQLHISGLPVIDKQGILLGMFTEKNILEAVLPGYLKQVGEFVYEENPKSIKKKFAALYKLKVSEVMRKEVRTVNEDITSCETARIMLVEGLRRILVLNKDNKVVGVISRGDIVMALKKTAEQI